MAVQLQGNLVKKAHKKIKYTDKMLADLAKCSDPETGPMYFMENFLQIQHPTKGAIRFEPFELEKLLFELEKGLHPKAFENIEYAVVQSGVGLDLGKQTNTGTFNPKRLESFLEVCKKYGIKSKEHNGDYLSNGDYKDRFDLGLDSINIAPEFGQLETLCYLNEMGSDIEEYYQICYESKRWEKWVDKDFVPSDNKKELIKICGHYVFSDKEFLSIKPDIDIKIMDVIKNKLRELV